MAVVYCIMCLGKETVYLLSMVPAKMTVYSDDRSGEHGIGVDDNFVLLSCVLDGSVGNFN
jgi:hypothetical protein